MNQNSFLEINEKQLAELAKIPQNEALIMLNLLKFNPVVEETGYSGEKTYRHYMKLALPYFKEVSAKILFYGNPEVMLIGPADEELWDSILVIRYNSVTDFLKMIQAEGYPIKERKMALKDSRLIYCKPSI